VTIPSTDHANHSHYVSRFVRAGQVFEFHVCTEPGFLAAMDQSMAALHDMAEEHKVQGNYREALSTLPDHERLAAVLQWLEEGVPREKLLGDLDIRYMLEDLVPPRVARRLTVGALRRAHRNRSA
jgi:hypothetical protein